MIIHNSATYHTSPARRICETEHKEIILTPDFKKDLNKETRIGFDVLLESYE